MAPQEPSAEEKEYLEIFTRLRKRAKNLGLSDEDLLKYQLVEDLKAPRWRIGPIIGCVFITLIVLCFAASTCYFFGWPIPRRSMVTVLANHIREQDVEDMECVIPQTERILDLMRPPANCDMCRNITSVDRVTKLSREEFERLYAYTKRPVVIEDGQDDWTAAQTFSFKFFKNVYANDSPALDNENPDCQFFPYKTNFETLRDVFNMSESRAHLKDGSEPWYIGWSNCDGAAAEELRKHYNRPYFIPEVSESSRTDWIFMGSPGHGAHMHIDNVMNPSWQAQITGRKMWILEPPPECYFECRGASHMETVLQPGDIIVVDTNVWVHGTKVLGDEISICIGSEFD